MIEVDSLIQEMQEVKQKHSSLSIDQVLKIFEIKSLQELTYAIERARMANG